MENNSNASGSQSMSQPQRQENRGWSGRARRKSVPADEMAPVARMIGHDLFCERPNTVRLARQFGQGRADIQDAVLYEVHRRLSRVERHLGYPSTAIPMKSARAAVTELRQRRSVA